MCSQMVHRALGAFGGSCTGHVFCKTPDLKAVSRSTPIAPFKNTLTSGANEESVKSSERTEKRLPFVIFRGKCSFLSWESQRWKGGKKLVSVWRWIRFDKNALNAHKDSVSRPRGSRRRQTKEHRLLSPRGGHIIAWMSRLPRLLAIQSDRKTAFPRHIKALRHKSQWHPLRRTME